MTWLNILRYNMLYTNIIVLKISARDYSDDYSDNDILTIVYYIYISTF